MVISRAVTIAQQALIITGSVAFATRQLACRADAIDPGVVRSMLCQHIHRSV